MSIENVFKADTDSVHLFNYLKQEVPIEDIRDYASPRRIRSIDAVKGISIVMIVIAHCSDAWLNESSRWLYGFGFAFLDILGPSMFIFLSALSVVFSVKKKENKLPRKAIRATIFVRGIIIFIIGLFYGLYFGSLWSWNVLTFIGFAQIVSYYALRLKKLFRAIIGVVIILLTDVLRSLLYYGKGSENVFIRIPSMILHTIIVSPFPMTPLLPYLSICFISTIFGEYLYEAMDKGTKDSYIGLNRIFLVWGIIFIVISILAGLTLYTPETIMGGLEEYPHVGLYEAMKSQNFIPIVGMPAFLIRGTASNMGYSLGASLLIISIAFYIIDLKGRDNNVVRMFIYYGKISLTLFFIHQIYLAAYPRALDVPLFLIIVIGYTGFLGLLIYIWIEFARGIGSPEWLIVKIAGMGVKPKKAVTS